MRTILCISVGMLLMGMSMIPLVSAQTTEADGLFGKYFQRMTGLCNAGSNAEVIVGFTTGAGNFATKKCTPLKDILKELSGNIFLGNGSNRVNLTVNGNIVADNVTTQSGITAKTITVTQPISDVDSENTLVTKKYLEEVMPKIEIGTITMGAWDRTGRVKFTKKFQQPPKVMASLSNIGYWNKCRHDGFHYYVNITDITKEGFTWSVQQGGACGGEQHTWAIAWTALEGGTATSVAAGGSIPPEVIGTGEAETSSSGGGKYRSFVKYAPCYTRRLDTQNCKVRHYRERTGTYITRDELWFEYIDTVAVISHWGDVSGLIPVPIMSVPKKVIIRVLDHEAWDWPAIGTTYTFCENTDTSGCQYSFNAEHAMWNSNGNTLFFTVVPGENDVKLRYRGYDGSADHGGVIISVETLFE